jgi:tRNA(His) guanylyltransferase
MNDSLGDRMKMYEMAEAGRRLMPLVPVLARIDGRAFHSFTRGMRRPYDEDFSAAMIETTAALVHETNACMGYTQSDEITLAWHSTDLKSQIWFDGRVCKMTSQLAAWATLEFYLAITRRLPECGSRKPTFDARVWTVPNRTEAANVFVWREWDATKNSISMAAQSVCSHRELHGKHGGEMQEMLFQKGINWNDYPAYFKRGTYVQRRTVRKPFTAAEIERLPPKHEARSNPNLTIERNEIAVLEMPPIQTVENRVMVIFEGATPSGTAFL